MGIHIDGHASYGVSVDNYQSLESDIIVDPEPRLVRGPVYNILEVCVFLMPLTLIESIFSTIQLVLANKALNKDKENEMLKKKVAKWNKITIAA